MGIEFINGIVTFDAIWTTAIAVLLLLLGYRLRHAIGFLEKYFIPAPVIGGLLMALALLFMHHFSTDKEVVFTPALQGPLMIAFFTTIGLGGRLDLLKKGGIALIIYLLFCWLLAIIQNVLGVSLAHILGIDKINGVMAGAVSLEGGHGAATAFGETAELLGAVGAKTVGIASATYGLIAGGMIGGPVAFYLIKKYKVKIEVAESLELSDLMKSSNKQGITSHSFMQMLAVILIVMVCGKVLSSWVSGPSFVLPGYVGAMFFAVLFRNLNDYFNIIEINDRVIDLISDISLGIFLTMAMMTLRIWEIYELALPLIIILVVQTAAVSLIAIFALFPAMGKDYDAAVITAGFLGHGLGATPNAVANMGAVCEHYQLRSYKAFLIVPLSGAVLIDLVGIPLNTWFVNYFAPLVGG